MPNEFDKCNDAIFSSKKRIALRVPANWIDQLPEVYHHMDTLKSIDVPEEFADRLKEAHIVPVQVTYSIDGATNATRDFYDFSFARGQVKFYAKDWMESDLEIKYFPLCK